MSVRAFAVCSLLSFGLIHASAWGADEAPKKPATGVLDGNWLGKLDLGATKLRLGFVIDDLGDGEFEAKLFSIDQGNVAIPVDSVEVDDNKVVLSVAKIGGKFEGKWDPRNDELAGDWKQSLQSFPLTLKKIDVLPGMKRPQNPAKPYPYLEEEVSFTNKKDDVTLKGTLTLPKGTGPFPAAVLISGSGPQDRDEIIFGHRPFLILADALTRRGIAVLRFDDRDFGKPGELFQATTEQLGDDVMAGVELLRSRRDIDSSKIGLVGHSEGGLIAPLLASRDEKISFIVMIAGPGLNGEEILLEQMQRLGTHLRTDEATREKDRSLARKLYAIVKSEPDDEAAMKRIEAKVLESMDEKNHEDAVKKTVLKQHVKTLLKPWFRYFIAYDPRPALAKVRCPVLAVVGEKDCQVSAKENLAAIEASLKEGGNRDAVVKNLPGLNHLLQPCQTGMPNEYAKIETTIDPDALKLITDWIAEKTVR